MSNRFNNFLMVVIVLLLLMLINIIGQAWYQQQHRSRPADAGIAAIRVPTVSPNL